MNEQVELHNRLAGEIVASIVKPPLADGGSVIDVMVLLESVVVGVLGAVVLLGGDERVLETLTDGVRQRMAELRLGPLEPGGRA